VLFFRKSWRLRGYAYYLGLRPALGLQPASFAVFLVGLGPQLFICAGFDLLPAGLTALRASNPASWMCWEPARCGQPVAKHLFRIELIFDYGLGYQPCASNATTVASVSPGVPMVNSCSYREAITSFRKKQTYLELHWFVFDNHCDRVSAVNLASKNGPMGLVLA
jgi:hypothetical protein